MSLFRYGRESFDVNINWPDMLLKHLISTTKDKETIIDFIKNTIPGKIKVKHENNITTIKIKSITDIENKDKIKRMIRKLQMNNNFKTKYKIEENIIHTYTKILLMEVKNE